MKRQTQRRDHRRDRPRHEHGGAHQRPAAEGAVHREREHAGRAQLERDGDDGEEDACAPAPRGTAESRSASTIVGEADERPAEPGHAQVVAGAATPRRSRASGKSATRRIVASAGAAKRPRQAGLARSAGAASRATSVRRHASLPPRGRRGRSSACISAAALGERRPGLQLPGQRAMQVDLQDLRELGVDRRHRPRDGVLDDAPGLRRRNRQRIGRARDRRTARAASGTGPTPRARSSICSGAVRYSMTAQAAVGMGAVGVDRELLRRRAPQSAGRPGRPASRRDAIAARHARVRAVLHQRIRVRPVAHERASRRSETRTATPLRAMSSALCGTMRVAGRSGRAWS